MNDAAAIPLNGTVGELAKVDETMEAPLVPVMVGLATVAFPNGEPYPPPGLKEAVTEYVTVSYTVAEAVMFSDVELVEYEALDHVVAVVSGEVLLEEGVSAFVVVAPSSLPGMADPIP